MPEAKRDVVRFAVYQRQEDATEMVAYIIKDDDFEDHNEYMTENGYELCEVTQGETFKAITGEAFYIRIAGDLKVRYADVFIDTISFHFVPPPLKKINRLIISNKATEKNISIHKQPIDTQWEE